MVKKRVASGDEGSKAKFWSLIFGDEYENGEDPHRINVMTRVRTDIVEIVDALVELGVFNSRSEAVSAYIEQTILSQSALYAKLKTRAQEMGKVRESAVDLIKEFYRDDE